MLDSPDLSRGSLRQLKSQGAMIGLGAGMPYPADVVDLGANAQLFLYSDGVFEIEKTDGVMWSFDEFLSFLKSRPPAEHPIEQLLTHVRLLHGSETLGDDFSMLRVDF
jgi:sigma-B regulation protein RsbU (phosphoserine phosphatase)